MSLTYNEILMLAVPVVVGLLAGLKGWWNYATVMRRRDARKTSELSQQDESRTFLIEGGGLGSGVNVIELSPGETDALRSMMSGKAVTRLQQANTKAEAVAP